MEGHEAADRLRVVVVDDSLLIREGVRLMLEAAEDIEVIASCDTPEAALAQIDAARPDVVLTDIRMPPTHTDEGIALAREVRRRQPGVGVVVLSQHVTPDYALALLETGSDGRGYLLKDRLHDLGALASAIRTVARGGCQIDPLVVEALMAARSKGDSPLDELTPREREILADIAEGYSNSGIAERRVLTKRAVEKHASAIFMKLGLTGAEDVSRRVKATLIHLSAQD